MIIETQIFVYCPFAASESEMLTVDEPSCCLRRSLFATICGHSSAPKDEYPRQPRT